MNRFAEWWHMEDGGYFCSNCGLWHDDCYFLPPDQCESCGCLMKLNTSPTVWRDYRLSLKGVAYADESECPKWLLELRNKYINNDWE